MIDLRRMVWIALAAVLLLLAMFVVERRAGVRSAETQEAERQAARYRRLFHVEHALALRADTVAKLAVARATRAEAPHTRSEARTDTAGTKLDRAVARVSRLVSDSAVSRDSLGKEIRTLASSEAYFRAKLTIERDSTHRLTGALKAAQDSLVMAVDVGTLALVAADKAEASAKRLEARLKGPGFVRRGFGGILAGVATVTCGAVGYVLAGPFGSIAGLGCGAIVGILNP